MTYTIDPDYDASVWEDEQEAEQHKFEQACYTLSFEEQYDPCGFFNFSEAVQNMHYKNAANLEDLLQKAEATHSEKDLAAVGRFLLEASREWQMEIIKDVVSGG